MDKLLFAIACIIVALAGIFGINKLIYALLEYPLTTVAVSAAILFVYIKTIGTNDN